MNTTFKNRQAFISGFNAAMAAGWSMTVKLGEYGDEQVETPESGSKAAELLKSEEIAKLVMKKDGRQLGLYFMCDTNYATKENICYCYDYSQSVDDLGLFTEYLEKNNEVEI